MADAVDVIEETVSDVREDVPDLSVDIQSEVDAESSDDEVSTGETGDESETTTADEAASTDDEVSDETSTDETETIEVEGEVEIDMTTQDVSGTNEVEVTE